jgi:hypothetical protein
MKINTTNFEIEVRGNWGYFEHKRLGDECAANLTFDGPNLVDFSGVSTIPDEVREALIEHGALIRCWG